MPDRAAPLPDSAVTAAYLAMVAATAARFRRLGQSERAWRATLANCARWPNGNLDPKRRFKAAAKLMHLLANQGRLRRVRSDTQCGDPCRDFTDHYVLNPLSACMAAAVRPYRFRQLERRRSDWSGCGQLVIRNLLQCGHLLGR